MKTKTPKAASKTARKIPPSGNGENGNGRIRFLLKANPAREVFVAGDFNGWDPTASPLKHDGNGCWEAEIQLPPGRHEYLFVADGAWAPDSGAEQQVPNPFGGVNSVIIVSATRGG